MPEKSNNGGYRLLVHDDTIGIGGELRLLQVPSLRDELESILKQWASDTLILDLSSLQRVDSAGALALIRIEEFAHEQAMNFPSGG